MEKEKEKIETIEGGDSSSDSVEYTEQPEEREDTSTDDDKDDKGDKDFREKPAEKHRIEGGDTEWDEDQEGADLEDSGEKEVEKKVEKEEEEVEVKKEEELSEEDKKDKQTQEDVIKYLDDEGGGTKYIIKGKEYDMRDLTPQEFKQRFSLAGRAYQVMEEGAKDKKQIIERERLAEEGARRSQDIMRRYDREPGKDDSNLPDILKPDDDDTDLEKSLKEMNANLYSKVDKLERGVEQQDDRAKEQYLYRELDSLQEEFPMMSKSEVVAVKSMNEYSDVDIRLVAENSHNERMGDKYLDAVFKARPDKLREIEEKAIERHLTGKPNVRKVSRRKSSTVTSGKISSGKKKTPRTLDEIEAHVDKRGGWDEILPPDED